MLVRALPIQCLCFSLFFFFCILPSSYGLTATTDMYWPTSHGARCVNLTEIPTLFPGAAIPPSCLHYVIWDKVYVDNNTLTRNLLGRVGMGGSWSSPDCLLANWRTWCTLMFRPCVEIPVPAINAPGNATNLTIAVGQYTCRQYCTDSHTACYDAIVSTIKSLTGWTQSLIDIAVSCDPLWNFLYGDYYMNVTIFPNTTTYTFPLTADGGLSYFDATLPCYDGNYNISAPIPDTLCPSGLYFSGGECYFNCPEPLITDSEYDAITIMVSVMGWISIVSCAFLALTFLMDPDKRKFPANLSVFFILCIFCLSFTFCLGSMVGWRDIWCDGNDHPNTFGDAACTVQGMTFVYFSLASVLWWFVLSFNLLLMVTKILPHDVKFDWPEYLKGLKENIPGCYLRWETLWVGYHIFAWIPPFIPLIIAMSAQRLGYGGHDIWCTIHSGDSVRFYTDSTGSIEYTGGDPANIWNLILLTVPILTIVFLGICILIFVVIWGVWKMGWRFFVQQWRLFLFIMFYIWIYSFVFSFQIHLSVQADSQYQEYRTYINCQFGLDVLQSIASPSAPVYSCDTQQLNSKISFPLWFIVCFNEAAQGFGLLLLYGSSWRFFKTWWYLFTDPKKLWSSNSTSGSNTHGSTFTHKKVTGRRVSTIPLESGASAGSNQMIDEIDDDEETSSEDESSTTSSSEGEGVHIEMDRIPASSNNTVPDSP